MRFIAIVVYIILQIVFVPLFMVGLFLVTIKPKLVSRKLGVSSTAVSVISNRWMMHVFGIKNDPAAVQLLRVLPNGSITGLWLMFFPGYVSDKISGKNRGYTSIKEEGLETIKNVGVTREIHFDRLINKWKNIAEQFVVMGAGYDTRCYGELKKSDLKLFELDESTTQRLKIACLKKAGIDASHVVFVDVDFLNDIWYEKLECAAYDSDKKSIFVWQGVTPYLSEKAVRNTLREIKQHAAPGSIVLADFYDPKGLAGLKSVETAAEKFHFTLDFSIDRERILKSFVESENLHLGECHFMGHKTKTGAFGVVAEIIV
jgi:methyltransferase (TIGR00027 family)